MIPTPQIWPGDNSFRVAVFQPDLHDDFQKIEITLADAIASARAAIEAMHNLRPETVKPLEQARRNLAAKVDARRVLNDDFRHEAKIVLCSLARVDPEVEDSRILDTVMRGLRDAHEGSHRVADLIAAEKDIGRQRGVQT
jgi:hypothetical protein